MKKSKTHVRQYVDKNPIETNIAGAVVHSFVSDVGKGMASDALKQFIGFGKNEQNGRQEVSGDLIEGQELDLSKPNENEVGKEEKTPGLRIEPGFDYVREVLQGREKAEEENIEIIKTKIQEILIELKQLINTSQELKVEFKEIAADQRIVNPGKYHISFFEWILGIIRIARLKVEDSAVWLATFQSKKAKRTYWAMFKKHGTTFGLSNERVVATQTG